MRERPASGGGTQGTVGGSRVLEGTRPLRSSEGIRNSSEPRRFRLRTAVPAGTALAAAVSVGGMLYALPGMAAATKAVVVSAVAAILFAAPLAIHRTLRALREENETFAEAIGTLPHPCLIVGPGDVSLLANSAFIRMFEPGERAPLAALAAALSGDEGSAREFERLSAAAASGSRAEAEFRVETEDGGTEWRRVSVEPIGGKRGCALWIVEDVTSRHEMRRILRGEREKFIDYLDRAPVGFYSVAGDGRFLFVNRTLAAWLGRTPEDLVGGRFRLGDFLARAPEANDGFDPLDWTSGVNQGEVWFTGRDGRAFPATVTQGLAGNVGGGDFHTRSVVRNLAPEREMEGALRRSERRFHGIFADAPVGIALVDENGRVAECNRVFRRILGGAETDAPGLPFVDRIGEEDREEVARRLAQAAAGDEVTEPLEVRLRNGEERVVTLFASRMEEGEGGGGGLLLHLLDVTEQKRLEVQFAQSQKMQAVGQLAGGIAHDFNNLLTAMIGFCDLLLLRHRPGDQSFADIMQVKQNASRAANLVRQLLAFSRQQTLLPRVLDLADVLAELSTLLRRLIGERIGLKMIHGANLGMVKVDQGQLEQVIINLVVNARDAMPEGGTLTIGTANVSSAAVLGRGPEPMPPGDYVMIRVADTGVGIAKDDVERIFDPFFSTKEVGSGTGLGLATVYGIVKQTGGFIFVDSEPGRGTTFRILFPRYRGGRAGEGVPDRAADGGVEGDLTGAGTVLLVEDEDAVRLFGARALRNQGYRVLEARTGAGALDLLNRTGEAVDVLVTDVVMPEMDGPALVKRVRESRPDIRVVFISGYAETDFRKRLDADPGVHFLAKPFTLQQLAGKVKEATGPGAA